MKAAHGTPRQAGRGTKKQADRHNPPGRVRRAGPEAPRESVVARELSGLLVLAGAVFLSAAAAAGEGEAPRQAVGVVGGFLVHACRWLVGAGHWMVPLGLGAWGLHLLWARRWWSPRMWGVLALGLSGLLAISLTRVPGGMDVLEAGLLGMGGGVLGGALAHLLLEAVGSLGTWVLAAVSGLAGVVLVLGEPPSRIAARLRQAMQRGQRRPAAVAERGAQEERAVPAAPEFPNHLLEVPIAGPAEPLPAAAAAQETEAGQDLAPAASGHPLRRADTEYRRPGLELLDPPAPERAVNPQEIKERIRVLENTFAQFGIKVAVNQVSCGPSVTRYELQPAPGVKVSRIISLADDLQLSLAAQGIRIEAPIPGKAAIGVEVPNQRTALVSLRGLLQQPAFQGHESPLAVALGEDISGSPLVLNLADMPHLLIAGATGSGKSVCLNTIILSLLYGASPDELRLLLIDPKMVELAVYNGIPHLLVPVVTDARKAATALRWMVSEMEQRYQKFSEAGVRDIYRYHEAGLEALPFIVVVIDELADLMLVAPVEVEDAICRLAQMARAAGIHLVVATQRPSVDVVTGIIKANIPSRIAFAVSSQADSRTILDAGGAEKLLGRGDMLVQPVGAAKPLRVQGAFVSDAEIARVVDFIRGQGLETADESALPLDCEPEMEGGEFGDPLFWEAARVCVAHDRASVSLLQRKLRIGYSRAARLVDMLEERGLVSAPDVTRKREVLVDAMQLERLCRDNNMC